MTKGIPKTNGPAKTDQTGMLDTARHTYWNDICKLTPPADKEAEIEFLRKATAWNNHTNPPTPDNTNPETRTTTITRTPTSPPKDREHFPKRRQTSHKDSTKEQPPANPTPGRPEHRHRTQTPSEQNRIAKSYTLLANFRQTTRPITISEHLYTVNDLGELARINDALKRRHHGSKAHKNLLQHRNKLAHAAAIDSLLTTKAQQFNLVPIKVI